MREGINMINIISKVQHHTIQYASEELRGYLSKITSANANIELGLFTDFPGIEAPKAADPAYDDAIYIDVKNGSGIIAGVNPRSVLIGVYRYLMELGCRWVRPGKDGEIIPELDSLKDVKVAETPSYRHRGVCIEGAVSEDHVKDMVEWLPKLGFNGYFIQFREAHTFFNRWYAHQQNPYIESKPISVEDARSFTANAVKEIKKRDLLYHGVGHGWTCEPFGLSGMGWDGEQMDVPEETYQYLAQVNGKRDLWHGIPINTNLCYGNPEVRRIVVNDIANYSAKNPEIDIMHFWLADGTNNHCECDLCKDTLPSDFYVQMLNELDEALTEKGLKTRVVFLIYVDLLWPPIQTKINNPDRFILMFAPITRTYDKSFATDEQLPKLKPYKRNKLEFPKNIEENLAFLKAWQDGFKGDSFDFDYHMMWTHYRSIGYMQISDIVYQDMRNLKRIGLDGLISCQAQRVFLPTGLPMAVMGKTLWNTSLDYESIVCDYFASAFGEDGGLVRNYLEELEKLISPQDMWIGDSLPNKEAAAKSSKVPDLLNSFRPVIERNLKTNNDCRKMSWVYLKHHANICELLAKALNIFAEGNKDEAIKCWEKTADYAAKNEMQIHHAFDAFEFIRTVGRSFG